jgi:hypothetical protein
MSPEDLSRRAILAGAASVPALALPAVVAAAPTAPDATRESAIVVRAEQIVDLLRTRRICEGWKLDKVRADQFLQNVRRLDLKAGDTDLEGEIIAWAHDHGQSLDWLLAGDPISLVCEGAAHSNCAPNPDAKVVRARAQMAEADKAIDELLKKPQHRGTDCGDIPGFTKADRRRDKALVDLAKSPARSFEGLIANAEALTDRRLFDDYPSHQKIAATPKSNAARIMPFIMGSLVRFPAHQA